MKKKKILAEEEWRMLVMDGDDDGCYDWIVIFGLINSRFLRDFFKTDYKVFVNCAMQSANKTIQQVTKSHILKTVQAMS